MSENDVKAASLIDQGGGGGLGGGRGRDSLTRNVKRCGKIRENATHNWEIYDNKHN